MKRIILLSLLILLLLASNIIEAFAKTIRVKGGFTKSGTYRSPHYRKSPNKFKSDNYSTKGNINPYTGKKGTKNLW